MFVCRRSWVIGWHISIFTATSWTSWQVHRRIYIKICYLYSHQHSRNKIVDHSFDLSPLWNLIHQPVLRILPSVVALHCTTSRHEILPLCFINHSKVVLSGFGGSLALIYHQPFLISKSKLKISGRNNWDGVENLLSGHGLPFTQFFLSTSRQPRDLNIFLILPLLKQPKIMPRVVDKCKLRAFAIFLCGVQRFWDEKCKTHLRLSFSFNFILILKTFSPKNFILYVSLTYWQETVKRLILKKLSVKKLFAFLSVFFLNRTTLSIW